MSASLARRLAVTVCCSLLPGAADAATFVVNTPTDATDSSPGDGVCETAYQNGVCTLRAAIMEANRAPGSTVDLTSVPGGTILLGIPASGTNDETTGDLNIRADMTIVGAGALVTTIDANRDVTHARAFHLAAVTATITGVTIRNGEAGEGGGLYLEGSAVLISDCAITGNRAGSEGGGIYQSAGAATIERTTVDGNHASVGGGISARGDSMRIARSAVTNNQAGGPYGWLGQGGGGILAAAGLTTIDNVTISGNSGYSAGGILVGGLTRVYSSTITHNSAVGESKYWPGQGGGVVGGFALFSFQNTILAGNSERYYNYLDGRVWPRPNDCRGTFLSGGNNVVGYLSYCNIIGPLRSVSNLRLGPLQNNGGPTATHALLPGSDAIDAGNSGGCRDALGNLMSTDQRGMPRPFGAACDIGAFEAMTCTYTLDQSRALLSHAGGAVQIPLRTNDGRCSWSAVPGTEWMVVTDGVGGTGNGTVSVQVLPNRGAPRTGVISIAGLLFTIGQASIDGPRGDFDGDGRTDIAVLRRLGARGMVTWYVLESGANYTTARSVDFGGWNDVPVPGDYDGDGKSDLAVFRPSSGHWFILLSSANYTATLTYQWGTTGDVPLPADYDGDGLTDLAVYRPSAGTWYLTTSSSGFTGGWGYAWGQAGDVPITGDFDGDGRPDLTTYRPSSGEWLVLKSTSGYTASESYQWGTSGDVPVPGDYDGDGRQDLAIYRPLAGSAMWYIATSSSGYTRGFGYSWGVGDWDVPVPGDYDGDTRTDLAVYRARSGHWFILLSSAGFTSWATYQWGTSDAVPVLLAR